MSKSKSIRGDKGFIYKSNFMRNFLLNEFNALIKDLDLPSSEINQVGVVGGYDSEPELRVLSNLGFQFHSKTIGIDDSDIYLDLNILSNRDLDFDFVVCSQVIEHVWNYPLAFKNIFNLVRMGGYAWISLPMSNRAHGSPAYYSAGFSSAWLRIMAEDAGFEVITCGQAGTKRNYLATHMLPWWLSVLNHRIPISLPPVGRNGLLRFIKTLANVPSLVFLSFSSPEVRSSDRYSSEAWVLLRKPGLLP